MTKIHLCQIPDLSTDYHHVLDFSSNSSRRAYFKARTLKTVEQNCQFSPSLTQLTVATVESVGIYDYLWMEGSTVDEDLFFFIVDEQPYTTRSTSTFQIQLDVFTTYWSKVSVQSAFVERMHVDRWNGNTPKIENMTNESFSGDYQYKKNLQTGISPFNGVYLFSTSTPIGTRSGGSTGGGGTNEGDEDVVDGNFIMLTDGQSNQWALPLNKGYTTALYGYYPNSTTPHYGIDYTWETRGAIRGAKIYADGDDMEVVRVVGGYNGDESDYSGGFGNYVTLYHASTDSYHIFGHMLSDPLVSVGDIVNRETVLGYVGTSGYSTGYHLHHEIRYGSNTSSATSTNPNVNSQLNTWYARYSDSN